MARKTRPGRRTDDSLRAPLPEQMLSDAIHEIPGERILCGSIGRGQFADAAAASLPAAAVTCHFLDIFPAEEARYAVAARRIRFLCTPDFPDEEFDVFGLPIKARGEAELTRDMIQAGYQRLVEGGRFLAAVDNPHDAWLHDELRKIFAKVTRRPQKKGVLYLATKTGPLKKVKNFDAEFAFRDQERLIQAVSRPGVFSHRRLDGGARALMNAMDVREGFRVLDLGCGTGVVGFAAACRAENVSVLAIDSNARAIQCTERGAQLNGLTQISTHLTATGEAGEPGSFDLVLGNPPYFSNYRIADIFLQAAKRALKPGGRVLVVTKTPHWYSERMPELFEDVSQEAGKNYYIVLTATQGKS